MFSSLSKIAHQLFLEQVFVLLYQEKDLGQCQGNQYQSNSDHIHQDPQNA